MISPVSYNQVVGGQVDLGSHGFALCCFLLYHGAPGRLPRRQTLGRMSVGHYCEVSGFMWTKLVSFRSIEVYVAKKRNV